MNDYCYTNNKFLERASTLIWESGKTQEELVEALGLSNGSIADLKNKKVKTPSAKTVCILADYFKVSTDWLLGLTDIKSTDKATKELCDTLGLTEEAIEVLQDETDTYAKRAINWLINQHCSSNEKNLKKMLEVIGENKELMALIKDKNQWEPSILCDSILYCLSNLVNLIEKPTCDIQFSMLETGTLEVDLFNAVECTNEIFIENANQKKSTNSNLDNTPDFIKEQIPKELVLLPEYSFSYKAVIIDKFKQNIINILTEWTREAIDKQSESNIGAMNVKIIAELYNRRDDNDGNDTKKE